jgi:hypothetical protein
MFWLIPLISGALTAAAAWLLVVSGDVTRPRRIIAIVLTLAGGALASGVAWVVLGQRADPSGAWSARRVENALGGMAAAVFAGLVALFLPLVLSRLEGARRWVSLSLLASTILAMFAFLSWFGAVSW